MPLTISPPPGIRSYCGAVKHLKTVIAFFSCFFAMPAFSQLRVLTVKKENADPTAEWFMIGTGNVCIRESAADISLQWGSIADFVRDVKASSISSGFYKKFNLQKLFS